MPSSNKIPRCRRLRPCVKRRKSVVAVGIKPKTIISRDSAFQTSFPTESRFPPGVSIRHTLLLPPGAGKNLLRGIGASSATLGSKVGHTVERELRSPVAFPTERWGGGGGGAIDDSCGPSRQSTWCFKRDHSSSLERGIVKYIIISSISTSLARNYPEAKIMGNHVKSPRKISRTGRCKLVSNVTR